MRKCLCLLSVVLCLTASASHISETLTLAKGWNAVYLESTPDGGGASADCAAFFAGLPVTRVGCYRGDAYSNTEQYGVDGREIVQKPLSYRVWMKDEPDFSSLGSLQGGNCYLIYATAACSKTFTGVPAAPRMTWRKVDASGSGFLNIVGVSTALDTSDSSAKLLAAKYFGEGPYGTANGGFYTVGGTKSDAPTFTSSMVFGAPKVKNGQAYALTAERADVWPGVIEVQSTALNGGMDFADGAVQDSISVCNRGNTNHVFRLSVGESALVGDHPDIFPTLMRKIAISPVETVWTNVTSGASWPVELAPGEAQSFVFAVDRTNIKTNLSYGAVLAVEDLGESKMRVRVPISVDASSPSTYPRGLWVGSVVLGQVNYGNTATPLPAAGTMKAAVILHVDEKGKTMMLPHVALAEDTNGVMQVFHELNAARKVNAAARRITSIMLGTTTKPVTGKMGIGGSEVGMFEGDEGLAFSYVLGENDIDNPFRHAFHPDHDGVSADYTSRAPSGDDLMNYCRGDIKPELWSVSNTVHFVWKDDAGNPTTGFSPEELSYGIVEWKVEGLKSKPVVMRGMFAVRRINDAIRVREN